MARKQSDVISQTARVAAAGNESPLPAARPNQVRSLTLVPHRMTPQERHFRIAEIAYRKAELRGFTPGREFEDWLEAESEVNAIEGVASRD